MTSTRTGDITPISFARGVPAPDLIAVDALADAAAAALRRDPFGSTAYGDPAGYAPLRELIATEHGVHPDQVLITNGSLQGCSMLFDEVVREGATVVVEDPTYDRTLAALHRRGADVLAIPLDEDGLRVDELRSRIGRSRPPLAHVIPTFQNPAGVTLSSERRQQLLELAQEHDMVLFEDDPYRHTRFAGKEVPTILSLDPGRLSGDGQVIYASSFSKTVAPGLRVGYLAGPRDLITRLVGRGFDTYLTPTMLTQSIAYELCSNGAFESGLVLARQGLRTRMEATAAALREHLPVVDFSEPGGGYFIWARFPDDTDLDVLLKVAAEQGVVAMGGRDFGSDTAKPALRLAYAGLSTAEIEEGIRRLASAFDRL